MNRQLLAIGVVALLALTGCSAFGGSDTTPTDSGIELENDNAGATNVTYGVGIEADGTTDGEELTAVGATYPREAFAVDSADHRNVSIGVDTDGDDENEHTFNETHVSGVNNNAYSFDVTLDTDYTLQSGDVVSVSYPAITNPSDSGNYTVEVRLNDRQTANATVAIE